MPHSRDKRVMNVFERKKGEKKARSKLCGDFHEKSYHKGCLFNNMVNIHEQGKIRLIRNKMQ